MTSTPLIQAADPVYAARVPPDMELEDPRSLRAVRPRMALAGVAVRD